MWRLLLAVALLCPDSEGLLSCKNEAGAAVDWYILYKRPNSYDFYYIDPSMNNGFESGSKPINHQSGVLANTLDPIFAPTPTCGYAGYNDQPPVGYARTGCGHSKGIVMVDDDNVVWLLHSTPRFPFSKHSNNFFPTTGMAKAQTFICVTFPNGELKKIEQHLRLISANIFEYANEDKFSVDIVNFYNVWIPEDELNQKTQLYQDLKSDGNQLFKGFFKKISSGAADGDLYVAIANAVNSNVFAQTWGCQRGRCGSYCPLTGPKVFNSESITFSSTVEWKCGSDHSKWCVSENDWVCVGDSNRSETQFKRPGGALCLQHSVTKAAFRSVISGFEDC
ncbi:deoxyribonuclease-2-alpha-like [Betta splendens]|uniref:Deoxyribonuclease-2-alpha n=1 Tax=Betta splendens TaxID=158456 RepID=A0A6P7LV32_BETSP|nr:deoxyribonuclease-2-alpha-like [Betta splendens]